MTTTKNAAHREPMTDSETLREDLEHTRQHLAGTVQELTRRLNVPHRMKETASSAGHRMSGVAGQTGQKMKELPATSKRHPKAAAAVGGAVVLGAGAMAWMARRHK
jgi:hypothetical protein